MTKITSLCTFPMLGPVVLMSLFLGSATTYANTLESLNLEVIATTSSGAQERTDTAPTDSETYRYGEALDIQEILSITDEASAACGIVPVQMLYKDSQGTVHELRYQVVGNGCQSG